MLRYNHKIFPMSQDMTPSLRNAMRIDLFARDRQGPFGRFAPGNVGGDCEAGVVVDELEDHTFATTGQRFSES